MFILYGWDTVTKQEKLLGKNRCTNCNNVSDMYLARTIFRIKIFLIPVLWWTTKRFIMCSNCGIIKTIDKNEYKELKNNPEIIYNEDTEYINEEPGDIASWKDNVINSNIYMNYDGTTEVRKENNSTQRTLLMLLKIALTPCLTLLFWFIYLCIVAMCIPAEAKITDVQGWTSGLLGLITALVIVSRIKIKKK